MYDDYDTQIQCEEMEGFIPTEEDYAEFMGEYPSGLRGRIANPLIVGSNPISLFLE